MKSLSLRRPRIKAALEQWLHAAWERRGVWATLTQPLACLTGAAVRLKYAAYERGWRRSDQLPVPVVVVGNIYIGGTGKTPLLQELTRQLRQRGWHPGIVSRGYGVSVGRDPRVGQGYLHAHEFGDEPALLARTTGTPLAIHPRRTLAACALLQKFPEVDVILLDDGLQHLALKRDVEIVMQDKRGLGNGLLLPAGPLREPAQRLQKVDALVTNIGSSPFDPYVCSHSKTIRTSLMRTVVTMARRLVNDQTAPLATLNSTYTRIAAMAGIGQPSRFFESLRHAGVRLTETHELPDHVDFRKHPCPDVNADIVLITEKDAVKCDHLGDHRLWVVPVHVQLSDDSFYDWLHTRLKACSPNP